MRGSGGIVTGGSAAAALSCAVLLALAATTVARNDLFRDPLRLWAETASQSPDKRRPRLNYGHMLIERQQFGRALEQLQALPSMRDDGHVRMSEIQRELSLAYFALGLNDLAIAAGQRGLRESPGDAHLLTNIAAAYLKKQHYESAIQYARAAHRANPDLMQPLNILGESHLIRREFDQALQYMLLALDREPGNSLRYWNVAAVYEAAGRSDLAGRYYTRFLEREQDPVYRSRAEERMRALARGGSGQQGPASAR